MLPSPIAVKVEVTGKMLKDEADTEDYENEGFNEKSDELLKTYKVALNLFESELEI